VISSNAVYIFFLQPWALELLNLMAWHCDSDLAGGCCLGEHRSAGESDGTVCPQGKKCLSEAVARAEWTGRLGAIGRAFGNFHIQ